MKWLKIVANRVSNLNSKGKELKRFLSNQAGVSLVELMISVGVSAIVILGAGTVMAFVTDAFTKIVDKDEAEVSITKAAYALRTIAVQAVDLRVVTTPGAGADEIPAALTTGEILDSVDSVAQFPSITGTPTDRGRMLELAMFQREASQNGNSNFQTTGIFFKTPWAVCPPNTTVANTNLYGSTREDCSGQLILAWNNAAQTGPLTNVFAATPNQLFLPNANVHLDIYDRMTAVVLTTTGVAAAPSYARDARFRLTARFFLGWSSLNYNYDPANTVNSQTKEVTMEVYVGFRNNFLGRSQLVIDEPERLHGSLYYFPFATSLTGL